MPTIKMLMPTIKMLMPTINVNADHLRKKFLRRPSRDLNFSRETSLLIRLWTPLFEARAKNLKFLMLITSVRVKIQLNL